MDIFVKLFSGIGTFFIEDPKIAIARFLLIVLGFILAGWDSAGSLNR
ncbi:hypothetical protein V2U99_20930 [Klebsiella variicola]